MRGYRSAEWDRDLPVLSERNWEKYLIETYGASVSDEFFAELKEYPIDENLEAEIKMHLDLLDHPMSNLSDNEISSLVEWYSHWQPRHPRL